MKISSMMKVWNYLKSCEFGNNIENIMKGTELARGTVKTNLFYLMLSDNVIEYSYGQNNKIYKIKHEEFVDRGNMNSININ